MVDQINTGPMSHVTSVVFMNSVRTYIRTMLEMQTLVGVKSGHNRFTDGDGAYKNPTAITAHIATFFRTVICSLIIRGNGIARIKKSFTMLTIPAARKKALTSMHFPLAPRNCDQKKDIG